MKPSWGRHAPTIILLTCTLGCATGKHREADLDARISGLEREEARRQARLNELTTQISAAERQLAQAQEQARRAGCRAERVAAEAWLAEHTARCGVQISTYEVCLANNTAGTSKKAATGCGLGILAGIVSGGALAPLAVAGCAGGYATGKLSERQCGTRPTCLEQLPQQQAVVKARVERLLACERGTQESTDGREHRGSPARSHGR